MPPTSAMHSAAASCLAAPLADAVAAARLLLASLAIALAGCAGLPVPVERSESHAIADVSTTSLAQAAAASRPGGAGDLSGFRQMIEFARHQEGQGFLLLVVPDLLTLGAQPVEAARRYFQLTSLNIPIVGIDDGNEISAALLETWAAARSDGSVGRQSATAAVAIKTVAACARSITASSIICADFTSIRVTPSGVGSVTGPAISVTFAPRLASAAAMAKPCFPDERLAR